MPNHAKAPLRPLSTVGMITAYVARWPLRHVYGGYWLKTHFDHLLKSVGSRSVLRIYGLDFRDSVSPPKINDLLLVSTMQVIILLGLFGLAWWAWKITGDYVLPAFIVFSVFHVIPSERDFLTSGAMADRLPRWITPVTSALSFVVSLPAMVIALPASLFWGVLGWMKVTFERPETR
ncbi:MAG: hypothetical protein AAGK80_17015 [Pseudomonadota bacterium]